MTDWVVISSLATAGGWRAAVARHWYLDADAPR
jgi:hypothetical protein